MCQVKFRNYCLQMEGILSFTLQMLGKGYHLYRKSCIEHPMVWGEELGDRFILNNRYEWGATQRNFSETSEKMDGKWIMYHRFNISTPPLTSLSDTSGHCPTSLQQMNGSFMLV